MEEISDTLFSLLVAGKMTTSEAFPFLLVQPPGQPVVLSTSVFVDLGLWDLCGLGVYEFRGLGMCLLFFEFILSCYMQNNY